MKNDTILEEFLSEEYPHVLDIRKLANEMAEIDKKETKAKKSLALSKLKRKLTAVAKELANRFDLTSLWTDFEIEAYKNSILSTIYTLIDRNYKLFLIEQIRKNNPDYLTVDLSYVPVKETVKEAVLWLPYELVEDDFEKLIEALKENTHLRALKLNNLDSIEIKQYLELATVLKKKSIRALYCRNKLPEADRDNFIKILDNHETLVQLNAGNKSLPYSENVEKQKDEISQFQSIGELKEYLKTKYLAGKDRLYSGGEIIHILENNTQNITLKKLAPLAAYGLPQKLEAIYNNSSTSAAFILTKLDARNSIGKKVEIYFKYLVEKCKTFEELQELLNNLNYDIQGPNGKHSPEDILKSIQSIMDDQAELSKINLTEIPEFGRLREKVQALKYNMEIVPESPPLPTQEPQKSDTSDIEKNPGSDLEVNKSDNEDELGIGSDNVTEVESISDTEAEFKSGNMQGIESDIENDPKTRSSNTIGSESENEQDPETGSYNVIVYDSEDEEPGHKRQKFSNF